MRTHRRKRMPRKTKEQKELENETKTSTTKTKKATSQKATTIKKGTTKLTNTAKISNTSKKKNSATTIKKTSKKSTTSKTTAKKSSATAKRKTISKKVDIVEYYDLPYRYNQTIVKVLAQTPTNLFIYWDISDKDRKEFQKQYGDNFFETTRPILIVHNNTLDYSFEVEINDFANSWYLHVADSKCDYRIELGRKPIVKTKTLKTDYICITTSNEMEAPNDRILFDHQQKMVYFRNVKTGKKTEKQITSISFLRNMGKIYNIYDLYKAIYQDENIEELYNLSNPSSGSFSSKFQ